VHITLIFFLPQLLVLAFLIFWMIRVRFTGWREPKKPPYSRKALD
jgi:hypothetical protein